MGTRVRWGPARHDNHEGQRMTPGAPTDGARSRFPGHRGSTVAGTVLKDSGKRRCSSKGRTCGSALIDEAGAERRSRRPVPGWLVFLLLRRISTSSVLSQRSLALVSSYSQRGGARRHSPAGPSPTGRRCSPSPESRAHSGRSRIGHSSVFSAPASSIEALGSTATTAFALRVR